MSATKRLVVVVLMAAGVGADAAPRVDGYGDPLPPEALARMGSVRSRQGATIHTLAFTPDGAALVALGWGENGIRVWDAATGRELRHFAGERERAALALGLSPDGKLIASAGTNVGSPISLWDLASGRHLRQLGRRRYKSAVFSPDRGTLAAFARDGTIELWDPASGELVRSWEAHRGGAWCGAFSPDGKTLISAGADGAVRAWQTATAILTLHIDCKPHADVPFGLSPDGKLLAVVSRADPGGRPEAAVRLWDLASGEEVRRLEVRAKDPRGAAVADITSLAFSPDGKLLATGGADHLVRVWDVVGGKELRAIAGHFARTLPLAFAPDGKTLAVADGGTICLHDPATGAEHVPLHGHSTWVFAAALSPDARTLATAGQSGPIHLWQTATGRELRALPGHENSVVSLILSGDGQTLYSAGLDQVVRVWDVGRGTEVRQVRGTGFTRLQGMALSADGKTLAVPGPEQTVLLLDTATGKERRVLREFEQAVNGLAFAASNLTTWTRDQTVAVWNPATGDKVRQFSTGEARQRPLPTGGTGYESYAAAVSADGRLVALGVRERAVFVLDTATGHEVRRLSGLPDGVSALAFAPDGKTLAWAGLNDPTVRLVELATGQEAHTFPGHRGRVVCLTFAENGRTLVSGGADTTALVWDLTGRLALAERWGKPLTQRERDICWEDLRGADAGRAWSAIRRLAADPGPTITALQKAISPVARADERKLARLLADLDSDRFEVRQQAADELQKLGASAVGACRRALAAQPSAEARRWLEELVEKQDQQQWSPSPERLRTLRALRLLELAGTVEARQVLEALGSGAPGAWLTEYARACLRRIHRQGLTAP
jgi:WD40 repeat protein